tara:strand:- start:457 stop:1101 length:645 start_codon:yes stop_codon:yes gene_type:complete
MAIADGMAINCSDLQAVGGTRWIALRNFENTDVVVFNNTDHTIEIIDQPDGADAEWGVFESRIESSSLTITGTNEGKEFTTYESTLSWFIPGLTTAQFSQLYKFDGDCLMALVVDNNDASSGVTTPSGDQLHNKVLGVSGTLSNQDSTTALPTDSNPQRTQQWCRLQSIEGGTGAAFSDEIGVTVTLVAKTFEIPRAYVGSITMNADGLGLVTG